MKLPTTRLENAGRDLGIQPRRHSADRNVETFDEMEQLDWIASDGRNVLVQASAARRSCAHSKPANKFAPELQTASNDCLRPPPPLGRCRRQRAILCLNILRNRTARDCHEETNDSERARSWKNRRPLCRAKRGPLCRAQEASRSANTSARALCSLTLAQASFSTLRTAVRSLRPGNGHRAVIASDSILVFLCPKPVDDALQIGGALFGRGNRVTGAYQPNSEQLYESTNCTTLKRRCAAARFFCNPLFFAALAGVLRFRRRGQWNPARSE